MRTTVMGMAHVVAPLLMFAHLAGGQNVTWEIVEARLSEQPQRVMTGMTVQTGRPTRYDGPVIALAPNEAYLVISVRATNGAKGINLLSQKFAVDGARQPGFVRQGSPNQAWHQLDKSGLMRLAPGCEDPCQPNLLFRVPKDKTDTLVLRAGKQRLPLSNRLK